MRSKILIAAVAVIGVCSTMTPASAAVSNLDTLLGEGRFDEAIDSLNQEIAAGDDVENDRATLGFVRLLQAVERLAQSQYRYGALQELAQAIPVLRVPVPANPKPDTISYEAARGIFAQFSSDLAEVERTLAEVDTTAEIKVRLALGRVRFDINRDGKTSDDETLWRLFRQINRAVTQLEGERFEVALDAADVHWVRGYCHVLMAFCDFVLAYDTQEFFERCGHLFYFRPDTPYEFLLAEDRGWEFDARRIADVIAAMHLINFPLEDAERVRSAHAHFLAMVQQSRLCWERALAETDDDAEWLPNPDQQGVLGVPVARAQIDAWSQVLNEIEEILLGKKLVPFWRAYSPAWGGARVEIPEKGLGVNVNRMMLEPGDFDLVMIISGTGVAPYLEEGPLSTPDAWSRMTQAFRGQFFGFALWFN